MVEELVEERVKPKKKKTKPTAKELKESRKTIDFWKKSKKGPGYVPEKKKPVVKKKKQKIPPEGISLGSSSTTTWKQTPTSYAVDTREHKKKYKKWLNSKNRNWANRPVRPPPVGAVAQVKRKTDGKGNSQSTFKGPGGMKPKYMDLYGNWLEKKDKAKAKKRKIGDVRNRILKGLREQKQK